MRKLSAVVFLFSFFCISHTNAQKLPNTLLWKISGHGLQKPSYLYGTFHLTDEKLFNLGDSLYNAIEHSDGFAIEVSPNEMMPYIMDMIRKEIKNSRRIKEMLGDTEYKKYAPSLSKKLKKPADDITTQDIFREKNKWVQESFQNGKMHTFLDAYLFDIARRQGKWVGGIEDMEDQRGLLDNLIDESDIREIAVSDGNNKKEGLDKFMQLYIDGDLNAIDSLMNFTDSAYRDALLIRRNKKMARRMDSLSRERTMVFAVGAAHLPGAEGLISLLRNKGFIVQPVFSSQKIKPENYKVKEVDIPWLTVKDPNGYYEVQMPDKPGDIEMFGMLDMKMYFDIFKSTGYLITSINSPYQTKDIDSIMSTFAENVFKEKKLKNAKSITVNGISGKEIERTDIDGYKRGYILYKNNVIYIVVGFAKNNDAQGEQEIKKFLGSYKAFENEISGNAKAYTYIDSVLAFRLELPGKPKSGNDLAGIQKDKSIKSNLMVCVDQQTGAYLLFGVNQATSGYSITNDSSTLAKMDDDLKEKYAKITFDSSYTKNHHRVLEYDGMSKQASVNMKAYYEFRGNRWYALVALYDANKPDNSSVKKFFSSFKLLDFPASRWKQEISEDKLFTAWLPSAIQWHNPKEENESSARYEIYDSTRSDTYAVVVEELGKYYWKNSDTSFWNKLIDNIVSDKDTLLYKKDVENGNARGVEIMKKERGSSNLTRKRMLLFGDTLYTLTTTQHEENINNDNVNKFFEGFRFSNAAAATTIYKSKAALLLNDLSANDSATRTEAREALRSSPFRIAELPLLHEAILKKYPDSDSDYESTNKLIADVVTDLKDSSSLQFAKDKYKVISDKKLKNILLDIISGYKTKDNYTELTNLLLQSHPLQEPSYQFIGNMKDSLSLAAIMFPAVLPLLKDTITAAAIINIAAELSDSNLIPVSMLNACQQDILQFAGRRHKKIKTDEEGYTYGDAPLISLLGKFNNATCNAMLQKWLATDKAGNYIKLKCITALVGNKQVINQQALVKLASDKGYRIDLYKGLKKLNKQSLFPKQYLTQQSFAQSMVYDAATEDDDEPSKLVYVSQKVISFKGKKARFFFYKVVYGDEDKTFRLACAGPFEIDITKMSSEKATGALYYTEDFDSLKLQTQIDALIKDMEGWYKWDKEKNDKD